MNDYIKRENAERLLRYDFLSALTEDERVDELNRIPSADVVEVVRCKDCKKRNTRTCMMNNNVGMSKDLFDDDYCSYGEQKEQEHE